MGFLSGEVQYLVARLILDTSGFDSALRNVTTRSATFGKAVNAGLLTAQAGFKFLERSTLVTAAAATALTIQFAKVQDAQAALARTITDESAPAVALLQKQILGLSKDIPVAVTELYRIAEVIGTTNVAADSIDELTQVVAKLSATTDLSADEAAISMARLLNLFGKINDEGQIAAGAAEGLGNALVRASQMFASSDQEVLRASLRFAALAEMMKLTEGQVLALAGATTGLGQLPEAVGGSFQRVFQIILKAVGQADKAAADAGTKAGRRAAKETALQISILRSEIKKLSDIEDPTRAQRLQLLQARERLAKLLASTSVVTPAIKEFAKLAGLTPAAFGEGIKTAPFETFIKLIEGFSKLTPTEQAVLFGKGGIFPAFVRGAQTLQNLGLVFDDVVAGAKELDAEFERGRTLEAAYAARTDTLAAKFQLLLNALTRAAVAFGEQVNEGMGDALINITRLIDENLPAFERFGRQVGEFIEGIDWKAAGEFAQTYFGVLKKGFDIVAGLPKELLALILLFKTLNGLTGGFASQLAGLATGGVLRLVFDQFAARGSGPHNPVWVTGVGLGGADISSGSWRRLLILLGVPIAFASGAVTTGDTPRALQGPRDAGQVAALNKQQAEYLKLIEGHLASSVPGSPEWQRWEKNRLALLGGPFGIGPGGKLPLFGSDLAAQNAWKYLAYIADYGRTEADLARQIAENTGGTELGIQSMIKALDALRPRHRRGEIGESVQSGAFRELRRLDISDPQFAAKLVRDVDLLVKHYTEQPIGTKGHPASFILPALNQIETAFGRDLRQALREGNQPAADLLVQQLEALDAIPKNDLSPKIERLIETVRRKRLSVRVNREPIHVRVGRPSVRTNVSVTIGKRSVIRSVYSGGGYGPVYVWGGNTGVLYEGPT